MIEKCVFSWGGVYDMECFFPLFCFGRFRNVEDRNVGRMRYLIPTLLTLACCFTAFVFSESYVVLYRVSPIPLFCFACIFMGSCRVDLLDSWGLLIVLENV